MCNFICIKICVKYNFFVGHTVISKHSRFCEYFTISFLAAYILVSTMVSFCHGPVAGYKPIAYSATHTAEADSS